LFSPEPPIPAFVYNWLAFGVSPLTSFFPNLQAFSPAVLSSLRTFRAPFDNLRQVPSPDNHPDKKKNPDRYAGVDHKTLPGFTEKF
jgi:hypothetical protein